MREWFIQLTNDLMPEPEPIVDRGEVHRHRVHELEEAVWRIKKAKGYDYEPTATEIWNEADGVDNS